MLWSEGFQEVVHMVAERRFSLGQSDDHSCVFAVMMKEVMTNFFFNYDSKYLTEAVVAMHSNNFFLFI